MSNNEFNQDIDYSRRGPWDAPIRGGFVKQHLIYAVIHDLKTEDTIDYEIKLDLGNSDDKRFLGKITFWATSNGRSVETMSVEEWERLYKR